MSLDKEKTKFSFQLMEKGENIKTFAGPPKYYSSWKISFAQYEKEQCNLQIMLSFFKYLFFKIMLVVNVARVETTTQLIMTYTLVCMFCGEL